MTITEERLVKLEATKPGSRLPWAEGAYSIVGADKYSIPLRDIIASDEGQKNFDYIVAAANALPDLLKEIRRLQGSLSEAERMREWWKASALAKAKSREYWEGRFRDLRELYSKALEQIKELEGERERARVTIYTDSEGKQYTDRESVKALVALLKEANEKIVALREKLDYWEPAAKRRLDKIFNLEEAHSELKGDYDVLKEQAKELAKHGQAYFDAVSEWAELLDEILDKVRQAPNEDAIRVLQRFIKQSDLLDDVEPLFEKALANLPPSLRGDE